MTDAKCGARLTGGEFLKPSMHMTLGKLLNLPSACFFLCKLEILLVSTAKGIVRIQ